MSLSFFLREGLGEVGVHEPPSPVIKLNKWFRDYPTSADLSVMQITQTKPEHGYPIKTRF